MGSYNVEANRLENFDKGVEPGTFLGTIGASFVREIWVRVMVRSNLSWVLYDELQGDDHK